MLTVDEKIRLSHLEHAIERGLKAFYEAGQALMEIRDSRLYRESYPSFEEYCRQKWEMSKTHANRLIEAAGVVESLTPIGVMLPVNEAQARPLAALSTAERTETMAAVATIAPTRKPTAQQVQRVAAAVKAKPELPQPGQKVTVTDERSPHYRQQVEVVQSEGVIVQAKTEAGQIQPFLINELAENTTPKTRAEKSKPKPNHYENLEVENEILKQRCETLEGKLTEAIALLQQHSIASAFIAEAQAVLA